MSYQTLPLENPRTKIVIVDDDDLFRESLGLNLAEQDFEVIDFPAGQPALDYLLAGNGADVVLLDWRMPGLDGPAVLRRLRESDVHVPVVFLTMLSDEIYEENALKVGCGRFYRQVAAVADHPRPAAAENRRRQADPGISEPGRFRSGRGRPAACCAADRSNCARPFTEPIGAAPKST